MTPTFSQNLRQLSYSDARAGEPLGEAMRAAADYIDALCRAGVELIESLEPVAGCWGTSETQWQRYEDALAGLIVAMHDAQGRKRKVRRKKQPV